MIATTRLILRRWREADIPALAALNADPDIARWLGAPTAPIAAGRRSAPTANIAQARAQLAGIDARFDAHGFGLLAVERRCDGRLIGSCGLRRVHWEDHPMAPCIEIAWRQCGEAGGQGYASEAAAAALMDGFIHHGLEQVFAFSAETNQRSQRVMERIGMRRTPARDFDHPAFATGHELCAHVVYAIDLRGWMAHLATCARSA